MDEFSEVRVLETLPVVDSDNVIDLEKSLVAVEECVSSNESLRLMRRVLLTMKVTVGGAVRVLSTDRVAES